MAFGLGGSGAYAQIASWSGTTVASVAIGVGAGGALSIEITTDTGNKVHSSGPANMTPEQQEAWAKNYAKAVDAGLIKSRADQTRAERHANKGSGSSPCGDMSWA